MKNMECFAIRWFSFITTSFFFYFPKGCFGGQYEKQLLHHLLDQYNTLERPVANESDPLQLSIGLTLMQIIDVDEKNQLLVTNIWLKLEWTDVNLRWNASEYGEVKDLRIPPHRIWKPDILMYNSADEGFDGTYPTNVVVKNNGSCLYIPPGIFKSTCKIDITWFPFDDQHCKMKFGSWTYDGFQIDLQLQDEMGGDLSSFITNGEWDLLSVPGKRNEIFYSCCPEPYVDITYVINIRRRTLYYFFNLIVPCVLIASMAVLGFTLPPDSGEKLSLGTYFNCIMFMVASSVVSTIIILNYHHRNADTHEMTNMVKILFLTWLPWVLRMRRPDHEQDTDTSHMSIQFRELELRNRSSKSLLANVLDIEDDFRHNTYQSSSHHSSFYRHEGTGSAGTGPGVGIIHTSGTTSSCIGPHRELSLILKELRTITEKIRRDEEASEITNDWKFAAMVVDRLCLIIFTLFTVIATIAVLLSAPHIIVQ